MTILIEGMYNDVLRWIKYIGCNSKWSKSEGALIAPAVIHVDKDRLYSNQISEAGSIFLHTSFLRRYFDAVSGQGKIVIDSNKVLNYLRKSFSTEEGLKLEASEEVFKMEGDSGSRIVLPTIDIESVSGLREEKPYNLEDGELKLKKGKVIKNRFVVSSINPATLDSLSKYMGINLFELHLDRDAFNVALGSLEKRDSDYANINIDADISNIESSTKLIFSDILIDILGVFSGKITMMMSANSPLFIRKKGGYFECECLVAPIQR